MPILISSTDLAKYIVTKCIEDKQPITNMQLQKILYCIQKDCLKRDKLAFGDNIEAWQFGPVVPNVYYQFSGFGAMPITIKYKIKPENSADMMRFDSIIECTRIMEPWDWIDVYQKAGGAWDIIYNMGKGEKSVIPTTLIKNEK